MASLDLPRHLLDGDLMDGEPLRPEAPMVVKLPILPSNTGETETDLLFSSFLVTTPWKTGEML